MKGIEGQVVEVGHWRYGRYETDQPEWIPEYPARVGAVLQRDTARRIAATNEGGAR